MKEFNKPFKGMYFRDYEIEAKRTASYVDPDYLPLGLAEETGELIHEFAKAKRQHREKNNDAILNEVGDVLWMLSQIAREHGFTLEEAATRNLEKLGARAALNTLHDKAARR